MVIASTRLYLASKKQSKGQGEDGGHRLGVHLRRGHRFPHVTDVADTYHEFCRETLYRYAMETFGFITTNHPKQQVKRNSAGFMLSFF